MIGTVVNYRYEVLEKCGDGNFFSVYKARDKVLNRLVAVKILAPQYSRNKEFAERLIAESQMVTDLSHSNVAKVLEADQDAGTYFVAVEYVRGINLKDRIRRTAPFAVSYAADIASAVAEALDHAHRRGIVHGDVRPHNVITSPEGQIKLTDFGTANALAAFADIREATMLRSVHYMAPEVIRGEPASAASDVYSLGVVLYEMLTGSVPYDGPTSAAVVARLLQDPVPSPRVFNSGVPGMLNDIVMKAMQKDPALRFANAAEFAAALARVREWLRTGQAPAWPVRGPEAEDEKELYEHVGGSESFVKNVIISLVAVLGIAIVTLVIILKLTGGMGSSTLPVPDLRGKTVEEAEAVAEQTGLKVVEYRQEYNDQFPAGQIWRTDPGAGDTVPKADPVVRVWTSKGPRLKSVPDVVGLSVDEAGRKVRDAGFVLGASPPTEFSDTVPVDHVIRQSPQAGELLEPLKPVDVVLSAGKEPGTETITPDETTEEETGPAVGPRERNFKVDVSVPPDAEGPQDVRVEVSDAGGDNIVAYEGTHEPGEQVTKTVVGIGERVHIQVFIGDKLVRDVMYSGNRTIRNRAY